MVITMTAGTAVIMWLGELITERGIGNGMSILIFTQVVATFPASLWAVAVAGLVDLRHRARDRPGDRRRSHVHRAGAAPDPVQYARRMVGRKMFGGSSTYIPLKVNQAGIIPVIFASSLLYLPAMAVQFNQSNDNPVLKFVNRYLVFG